MRAGMIALAILFPSLVFAAEPALTAYTVSPDTIYPSATLTGVATSTSIDIAFSEAVKVSIKIVSPSGESIKTLYTSSGVTNPAPKIWDGMNSTGARTPDGRYSILISATSTASGAAMTDSSKSITVASSGGGSDESPSDSSSEPPPIAAHPAAGNGTPEYLPPPALRIMTAGNRTVSSGADTAFSAAVYDAKGNRRDDALVTWSFGDGMQRTGANVLHAFYEPGEYSVVIHASTSDGGDAAVENVITAKDISLRITAVSERGITLDNSSAQPVDLSMWRLSMGGSEFKIPEHTQILGNHKVVFPSRVIQLPASDSAALLYPSGEVAAAYPAGMVSPQPSPAGASYRGREQVEAITRLQTNITSHENAVRAPAAPTEIAAAGAALPEAEKADSSTGLLHSPWALSLLGVIAAAGGAFIFL